MKPRLKMVNGQPVEVLTPLQRARVRYGKPFAHEQGSTFKPKSEPILTTYMRTGRLPE